MKKIHYRVSGTHCRSCELMLEKHIGSVPGVAGVHADYRTGAVVVEYHAAVPDQRAITQAVHNAGYSMGGPSGNMPLISRDQQVWTEVLVAGVLVFIFFIAVKLFGIDSIGSGLNLSAPSLATVVVVGLVAGISSCMALIGSVVLGMSASHAAQHPEASAQEKFKPHLFFHIGRIGSFTLLGGAIGALGGSLTPSPTVLGILIIAVGIVMGIVGLQLTEMFPRLKSGLTLPSFIGRLLGFHRATGEYRHRNAVLTGAATFFLPCGFTQAMQLYAVSTGSFTLGSIVMTLFALGTMPGLLGIAGLSSAVRGGLARLFFKFAGIVLVLMGLWNISNGMTLADVRIALPSLRTTTTATRAVLNGNVQVLRMEQRANGYVPNTLAVKKGIPVRWEINSTNSYTCASFLVVPALRIQKALQAGINVIEFTPTKEGTLAFSCSMGMYRGSISVIP